MEAKMNAQSLLTSAFLVAATALTVPAAAGTESQGAHSIQDQFVIGLPDGWSVYDQNEALEFKVAR
jgi:hypothetical protein